MSLYPLVVDLDGTLIHTDMLHESLLKILANNPFKILLVVYWLMKGKAHLKRKLANRINFDPSILPYNKVFLTWLKRQRDEGRKLILCTGTDHLIAIKIADYLSIFDEIIASDGITNLTGEQKAKILARRFGQDGFDYAGNSQADLMVWQYARKAVVVNTPSKLREEIETNCRVEQIFSFCALNSLVVCQILRVHQWLKNLLIFVPLLAAHQLTNLIVWSHLIIAFVSFNLCASSVYVINDLMDLESDRSHPRKHQRPFASGSAPIWLGICLLPLLLFSSFLLAGYVGGHFMLCILIYFSVASAYSWKLKRIILIDSLILALLYTLRIIAGSVAANIALSFWLITFSIFLFLSLAFVKRYVELQAHSMDKKLKINGRGYLTADAPLIQMLGTTSGYTAVLVLALYINSEAVVRLYRMPEVIWGSIPVVLFWVNWIWLQAHRGKMHDDPLIFALKDKASIFAGLVFSIILIIGTVGWLW